MAISGGVYMVNIGYGGVGSANGYYMEREGMVIVDIIGVVW